MFSTIEKSTSTPEQPIIFNQEEQVLKFSGLELNKELFVYDVTIELQGKQYQIHTYRCGDGNTDNLVLLHGYGGCSALYYLMLKDLSKRFRVFCLDTIGMGLSSKQKFECKSTEDTLDFLVGSIEKWRQTVGLETFYLVGHSFGGYISGIYAWRYQKRVKKLTLLSPVGVTKHEDEVTMEQFRKDIGFVKRILFGWFLTAWENKLTPGKFLNDHPWLGKWIVKNYVNKRFGLKDAEAKLVYEFLMAMLTLPEGAEQAIHYILKPPFAAACTPLEDIIANELSMPVDCFFGASDYMDTSGAKRIMDKKTKAKFCYKILPKAAHQLPMQNPKDLAEEIILSA